MLGLPMRSELQSRWFPAVLCVLVADLNFWYFASTGENDAEYFGIALFAGFAAVWTAAAIRRRATRAAIAAVGASLAIAMMVLREVGTFDVGYIPPYVLFLVSALVGGS